MLATFSRVADVFADSRLVSRLVCPRKSLSGNAQELEARVGIEPTHKAFAEPCLTTWLPRPPDRFSIKAQNVCASQSLRGTAKFRCVSGRCASSSQFGRCVLRTEIAIAVRRRFCERQAPVS